MVACVATRAATPSITQQRLPASRASTSPWKQTHVMINSHIRLLPSNRDRARHEIDASDAGMSSEPSPALHAGDRHKVSSSTPSSPPYLCIVCAAILDVYDGDTPTRCSVKLGLWLCQGTGPRHSTTLELCCSSRPSSKA